MTKLELKKEIRKVEREISDSKWGAGTWFVHIVMIILTGGIWVGVMLVAWFMMSSINIFTDTKEQKLDKLYDSLDENF